MNILVQELPLLSDERMLEGIILTSYKSLELFQFLLYKLYISILLF